MKVMTILGTRPEIIRLSLIIGKLDLACDHVLVHTGQNFDPALSDVFFEQLGIRQPDHYLGIAAQSFGRQVARLLEAMEQVLIAGRPDRLLVLGDTNSGLAAVIAKRMGIPVYHMEAGNRCYDDRVPEEINRRIIDHSSDVLMPYTERSRANLLREGIPGECVYVTGNPIHEVLQHYDPQIRSSSILGDLGLEPQRYFLVTVHRAENVEIERRFAGICAGLSRLGDRYGLPVIVSTHPHTRARMGDFGMDAGNKGIRFLPPFGLFDFVMLERNAACVLSDSGTVQEECCIYQVPNVTLRDTTERPETVECGSNVLSGADPETIVRCASTVLSDRTGWSVPAEYLAEHVSSTVLRILLSHTNSSWRISSSGQGG